VDLVGRLRLFVESSGARATRRLIAPAFALAALLVHAATSWRYGYFRDELYFVACAKHLAWGYVDQPPLVAVAAWLSSPAGYALPALRALPIIAAAATVYLAVRLTRYLGGGTFAQALAGTATLLLPAYLLLGNTLTTTSFEPFFWTLAVFAVIALAREPAAHARRWLWVALTLAIAGGAYGKYSMAALCVAVVAGLALTPQRRLLRAPALFCALAAVALLTPNVIWQAMHGWPFLEVIRGDATHRMAFQNGWSLESVTAFANARAFALEQLLYTNPVAAPIWLAGIVAPWVRPAMRSLRFVSIAYVVLFVAAVALAAKGYYIIGIYATLLAIGAVAVESFARAVRVAVFAATAAVGIAAAPLSLPLLPIQGLIGYSEILGLTGRGPNAHLIQPLFAEEFGWERLTHDVARVYDALPPNTRRDTAVYADTYGDAGALDFYGPRDGLPPVISSQNNYYLWGTGGYDGRSMIAVGATHVDELRKHFRHVVLVGTVTEPLRWIVEGPSPIYLCSEPVAQLARFWPQLRWYGA
jgi:hypothetical protein